MQEDANRINWEKIQKLNPQVDPNLYPKVSIIIPTFNDAKKIGITLESLISQDYPDVEILIIDAASTDRTLEIVKSFRNEKIRLSSVSDYNRYEMLNKGIFLARGTYLNFVFPGDYYIYNATIGVMMNYALSKNRCSLVYCGCLIREGEKEAKTLFRNLNINQLKEGRQPTSLQSCWFHKQVFQKIGKFDTSYTLRGVFDLFCRFMMREDLTHAAIRRVFTDYDLRDVTREMVLQHFFETARIIRKHFGFFALISWLFRQRDTKRYFQYWLFSIKKALVGR